MNRLGVLFFILLSLIFVAGCKDKKTPVSKADPVKTSQVPTPTQSDAEESKETYIFIYDRKGKRDPFVSLVIKAQETPKKGAPLESYDVGAIKVIGIVWGEKGYYAGITLPDGKAYTLKEGMTVGLHEGKVHSITKSSVIIKEKVKDYKGEYKLKETILKLREEEE